MTSSDVADTLLGAVLEGRFCVERVLGEGAMGRVYEAEELRLRRRCALKVLLPDMMADPVCVERFLREAQAIAQLHHENIPPAPRAPAVPPKPVEPPPLADAQLALAPPAPLPAVAPVPRESPDAPFRPARKQSPPTAVVEAPGILVRSGLWGLQETSSRLLYGRSSAPTPAASNSRPSDVIPDSLPITINSQSQNPG